MTSVQNAGVLLLSVGALAAVLAWPRIHRRRRRRRRTVPATVVDPAAPEERARYRFTHRYVRPHHGPDHGRTLVLAPTHDDIQVALGDTVQVYTDPARPGQAFLPERNRLGLAIGYLVYACLLVPAGTFLLAAGTRPVLTGQGAVASAAVTAGFLAIGVIGVVMVVRLARGLPGSRRVRGTVVDTRPVATGQGLHAHQPLVRYELDGRLRQVWAPARLIRPRVGRVLGARVEATEPREAVNTGPLLISGLLILLFMGAVGLAWLAGLVWLVCPAAGTGMSG